MKMPISEILDRYSIALLKSERTNEDLSDEIKAYQRVIDLYIDQDTIMKYIGKFVAINGMIWDLEADLRSGKEGELGLEEVGRRAIRIRELNKIRVGYKNELVEKFKEGFRDIKVNHASE